MKEKFEVKFNGKEYLEFIKYKDEKNKKLWSKENKIILTIFSSVFIVCITIIAIIDMLRPKVENTFSYSWEGIAMFLAIAVGLGWIIHGVGFLLIRR